ncbi:MAG TPA: DNA-binding response regulator [Flavobacteriales bacterium]|nr:DNA-binding response regulator [Crocinitomicaceae bacterium]HAE30208.1 DNA-binding response regulator [Flavobacteriales bacterium]|tara:strand:- start:2164 stop:2850 length:687 start_codon:yes stop_codon:yes gene_type:complete
MSRICVVEDEVSISELLEINLRLEGYECEVFADGKAALEAIESRKFDLILLDIMLPLVDGINVCEIIRLKDNETPILMLTAKNSSQDRIDGLKAGADDYLVKPFNLEELLLRIEKLLKRSGSKPVVSFNEFSFGQFTINFLTYEVRNSKGPITTLSKRQIMLIKLLIDRQGQVVSRQEILEKVWGFDVYPTTRTIDNYIVEFRKIFESNPKHPVHFYSIRGVGYKFMA